MTDLGLRKAPLIEDGRSCNGQSISFFGCLKFATGNHCEVASRFFVVRAPTAVRMFRLRYVRRSLSHDGGDGMAVRPSAYPALGPELSQLAVHVHESAAQPFVGEVERILPALCGHPLPQRPVGPQPFDGFGHLPRVVRGYVD